MSDPVELLCELIAVDTHNPGGDEPRLARWLAERLAVFSPDALERVEVPRGAGETGAYVFARFGAAKTLINAHIDTVPPNAGWSGDPYQAVCDADKLVALGSADTKGAIAALLCALERVPPRDVAILFSGDEECEGTCMDAFLASPWVRGIERALVCEPTGCRAATRHRGMIAMNATRVGRGGHSSGADDLPAPIAELARLAVTLSEWGRARRADGPTGFTGLCLNVAALDGGIAVNVVPESACLSFSVRPAPGADADAIHRELLDLCANVVPAAHVTTFIKNPSFATRDPQAFRPLIGTLVDEPIDLPFWTEAAALAARGIDAIVFGPGDIGQAHAPDEHVPISDLVRAQAVFEGVLRAHR